MGSLEEKVALVTGAARGTGRAVAELFVAEGARVLIGDVRDEQGAEVASALGPAVRYRHLDVTSPEDWDGVVGALEGRLDVLVNNAGVLHLSTIDETPPDAFRQVMDVNCIGAFLGTRACLPLLRRSQGGTIVNVGSIDGVQGLPGTVAYTASKFALRGLTKVTALENAKHRVRANCVCPAAGNPEMHHDLVSGHLDTGAGGVDAQESWMRRPLGRHGTPEDVAMAVLFFASEQSRFCTGADLMVDGGGTAGVYQDLPGVFSVSER